jgi:hypothetical protein
MRSLVLAAAVAVGLLAFGTPAGAQMVLRTGPTVIGTAGLPPGPFTSGYYSPYPGALYSPFARPQPVTSFAVSPRLFTPGYGGGYFGPGFGYVPRYSTFPAGGYYGRTWYYRR